MHFYNCKKNHTALILPPLFIIFTSNAPNLFIVHTPSPRQSSFPFPAKISNNPAVWSFSLSFHLHQIHKPLQAEQQQLLFSCQPFNAVRQEFFPVRPFPIFHPCICWTGHGEFFRDFHIWIAHPE